MNILTQSFLDGLAAQYWDVDERLGYAYTEWPVRRRSIACAITEDVGDAKLSFAYHTTYAPTPRALEFLEKYRKTAQRKITVDGRYWLNLELTILGEDNEGRPLSPEQLHIMAENEGGRFFQAVSMYEIAARSSAPNTKLTRYYRDRLSELQVLMIANDHLAS